MMPDNDGTTQRVTRCVSAHCYLLNGKLCSTLDVPLEMVTDCAHWHGREGFIKVMDQRVITDPYAYLNNYPDTIISFRENGIYINKSATQLLDYCKNNYPPMCWKNFKRFNDYLYETEADTKEAFDNTDVFISPHRVGVYDEGNYIRLDNITIETFVEQYLHFINYEPDDR